MHEHSCRSGDLDQVDHSSLPVVDVGTRVEDDTDSLETSDLRIGRRVA